MNSLYACYTSENLKKEIVESICISVGKFTVKVEYENDQLVIDISGDSEPTEGTITDLWLRIESLIFIYLGFFPVSKLLRVNDKTKDITRRARRFITSRAFINNNYIICGITSKTMTNEVLNNLTRVKMMPLYSLEYLVSADYERINVVDKMTLALHVAEGVFIHDTSKKEKEKEKETLRSLYRELEGNTIGDYFVYVHRLCKKTLFEYETKYNCGVLKALGVDEYGFLHCLSDTRNWYSHFLEEESNKDRIQKGNDFVYYFYLVIFMIRLYIVESLEVEHDEEKVKEFFFRIRDWILKTKGMNGISWKSKAYQIAEIYERLSENGYKKGHNKENEFE